MANIKKAFVELHSFLEANKDKKVSTVMDQVTEMCTARGAGGATTSIVRNESGEVVGVLDYYFKKWLPVKFVEFGAKAGSASGLNTMCKLGTSLWTKQQRDFKKAKEDLLAAVAAGEVQPTEIQDHLDKLEQNRQRIEPFPIPELAFDTEEELLAANEGKMEKALAAYTAEQERQAEEAAADSEAA